jgi:ubiquinone/menaquinone biosynthesis C-methylase UbiE
MLSRLLSYAGAAARNPRLVPYRLVFYVRRVLPKGRRYIAMQRDFYERYATLSDFSGEVRDDDLVVGRYHDHNAWRDYDDFLMQGLEGGIAMDFACGPGRNIVKYRDHFTRIDGADISRQNLKNAEVNLAKAEIVSANLYWTTGSDLGDAPSDGYDLVFSTIAMQHIAVHEIRIAILRDMFRVLKPGGHISIQMGPGKPGSVDYYANAYDAHATNGGVDTRVESPEHVRQDLEAIGFEDFKHWIRPTGPGDIHPNWIFFRARKPPLVPIG